MTSVKAAFIQASLFATAFFAFPSTSAAQSNTNLIISGVIDGPLTGGVPKAVELYVLNDITDLSTYGMGSANNGGGTDGQEFTFPAVAVTAGTYVYVASESTGFTSFLGFSPDYTSGALAINGDDAVELFQNGVVVDTFGDINVDGTGQPWEYMDGWAYRNDGSTPNGGAFNTAAWTFSGPNSLDGETTNATATNPFPVASFAGSSNPSSALVISGVIDGPLSGGVPKAVELYVLRDIADLSIYGLGSANNGGGTDGQEFTFPAVAATAGDHIYVASESTGFTAFFGFAPDHTSNALAINGDDAVELFQSGAVVDTFGDIDVDGTGEAWEHTDGWAYRLDSPPNGGTFDVSNWTFSGPNALDNETTNGTAATPFPIGTYPQPPSQGSALVITGVIDGPLSGGVPKAVELYVRSNIADLSDYALGSANNGGGSDGEEFTFPAVSATAGDFLYVASESTGFTSFIGFAPDYTSAALAINGDDAIELFQDGAVVDVFGDINVDGSGQAWEYTDGWAYRVDGTGPDGDTFTLGHWRFSGPNALDGETTNGGAAQPFPIGSYSPTAPPPPVVVRKIHEVQGSGATSPLVGDTVTIEAIVVGDFVEIATQDPTDEPLDGFFVQEEDADADSDPASSEGLFIFAPGAAVSVGDLVRVTGTVTEFFGLTELTSVSTITVVSSNNTLPTPAAPALPVAAADPIVDWEAIEGMSVRFQQTLFVTGLFSQGAFGEIQLSAIGPQNHPNQTQTPGSTAAFEQRALNLNSRVVLDDGEDENESFPNGIPTWNPTPTPYLIPPDNTIRSGDEVRNLFGVVNFTFSEYEVIPINTLDPLDPDGAVDVVRTRPRPSVPTVGGTLKVASFNVLNYFTTIDTGGAQCGPPGNQQGCRGADTQAEFDLQAAKIVNAIIDIDADVVGLIEIENNGGAAVADLVRRLNNAAAAARTYDYIDTGFIGTDAIAVALIYDVATVAPQGALARLDSTVSPAFIDNRNRVSLAQTFVESGTGANLTVVVNHLKSKGSPCDSISNPGDPAFGVAPYSTDPDDPNLQGNCNLTRTAAAQVLGQWLANAPTGVSSLNLLIIGDINAYANEDPIRVLEAQDYIDLVERDAGGNGFAQGAHTFVFDGEHGSLDYAMANPCLADRVRGAEAWHINADEPFAIDYQNFNPPGQAQPDEFKSSDHDPILVGLDLRAGCVDDIDGDGIPNDVDACEGDNSSGDLDQDGVCDDTDPDIDGDNVINEEDPNPERFGPYALKFGEQELFGQFKFRGQRYFVSIPLDQVRYGPGSRNEAWIKPEEYQKTVVPDFAGPGFQITCDGLEGPGVKGFARRTPRTHCTWKAGHGAAPTGRFVVRARQNRGLKPTPTFFNRFRLDARTLRGDVVHTSGTYPLSLELDVVDYRDGDLHKAFIRAQLAGNRLDTSALRGTRIRITGCDLIRPRGQGTDGIFGETPIVTCTWKRGNGRQPADSGVVVLQ